MHQIEMKWLLLLVMKESVLLEQNLSIHQLHRNMYLYIINFTLIFLNKVVALTTNELSFAKPFHVLRCSYALSVISIGDF